MIPKSGNRFSDTIMRKMKMTDMCIDCFGWMKG
jgi:hypothetical protein